MNRRPAEMFPPGEFIKDELEDRGWSQDDLAEILGRSPKLISEIISGRGSITPETAKGLAEAFSTSADLWLNLQSSYALWKTELPESVARKARLFQLGPIKEMAKRGWIEWSDNIAVLEKRVLSFYGIKSPDEDPGSWSHAARKSSDYLSVTPQQRAWLFRARQLAQVPPKGEYSPSSWEAVVSELKPLMANQQDVRRVPEVLSGAGIRFLVIKPLASGKIDGVTFWLGNDRSPVVAISLRYDRIDWFWHVLLHELVHLKNKDGLGTEQAPDVWEMRRGALLKDDKPEAEMRIEAEAADLAIPTARLEGFISRVAPLFSKRRIEAFAETQAVHPGIVVGQLQFRERIGWFHSREMLVPVRELVTTAALTDGWGHQIPMKGGG